MDGTLMPLNIVVCVKQVPDSETEKTLNPADNTLDRAAADPVLNELDEYGVEEALRLKEAHDGEVTVLSMGPERATETIRKALSMGADKAVHVVDDALHGSDAIATSAALAAAIAQLDADIVILGSESTDARMSVVPAMIAERLGQPQATFANKVDVDPAARTVTVQRLTDDGFETVEASLPAIVSVVEKINEPRYPSFKGIMAAKKKPVDTKSLADLGIDASTVGLAGAWTAVQDFAKLPPRQAGTVITDDGDAGAKVAEFLTTAKFI
jgi:electron transfer flavoprotein beta subunit